jgi:hypothetical protein
VGAGQRLINPVYPQPFPRRAKDNKLGYIHLFMNFFHLYAYLLSDRDFSPAAKSEFLSLIRFNQLQNYGSSHSL